MLAKTPRIPLEIKQNKTYSAFIQNWHPAKVTLQNKKQCFADTIQ
jgi:hypothetical protein